MFHCSNSNFISYFMQPPHTLSASKVLILQKNLIEFLVYTIIWWIPYALNYRTKQHTDLEIPGKTTTHMRRITFVGTEPHPIDTRQSILVSGHRSCASLIANMVGLFATIAPSCQRFISIELSLVSKNITDALNLYREGGIST